MARPGEEQQIGLWCHGSVVWDCDSDKHVRVIIVSFPKKKAVLQLTLAHHGHTSDVINQRGNTNPNPKAI